MYAYTNVSIVTMYRQSYNFLKLIPFFHNVNPKGHTQVIRLDTRSL